MDSAIPVLPDQVGLRLLQLEIKFNRAAGFTDADDRLPEYFTTESVEPRKSVFDVNVDDMDKMWA